MMLAGEKRNTGQLDALSVELLSGLFMILGVGAIIALFWQINTDPLIHQATVNAVPLTQGILAFLDSLGIIVPVVLIVFGIYAFRLGLRLRTRDVGAAAWAQQTLLWLVIFFAVMAVQALGAATTDPSASGSVVGTVAITLVMVGAYWWLSHNQGLFEGQEALSDRSTRTAWNLLVPTVVILILVAARPLERTFIASLTDERFASDREVHFVGLDNYAKFLGFRLDSLPCQKDANGACQLDSSGAVIYPRPRDYLDPTYLQYRYREVSSVDLFGTQLLFSARDQDFIGSIINTLEFAVVTVILELILGLFIALVVNSKFRGRGLMRAAMLIPWAIPTVVSARLWEIMLRDNQSGLVNHVLVGVGLLKDSQAWLANSNTQLLSMILIDVWKTTPFMALILLAGLQVIPGDIYEAADVDGASKMRQLFTLTLPLLRPTIAVALVFRTLDAVRVFDVFQVLLGQREYSMATYNYYSLINNQQLGYASAVGVVMFVIILVFAMIYVKTLGVTPK